MKNTRFMISAAIGIAVLLASGTAAGAFTSRTSRQIHRVTASRFLNGTIHRAPGSSWLTAIDMINSHVGFASGYSGNHFCIWSTTDGGVNWNRNSVPGAPTFSIMSGFVPVIFFQSGSVGWVSWINFTKTANYLVVRRTTDGGRRWGKYVKRVPQVASYVQQIDFSTSQDGWIRAFSGGASNQGDMTIFHTGNMGSSWTLVSSATGYISNSDATLSPNLTYPCP